MKRSQQILLGLSSIFKNKYAGVDADSIKNEVEDALHTAIVNATSKSTNGIMPFLQMLNQDQADLSINITRNGNKIDVSPPAITPAYTAIKYTTLPGQIKSYLERNLELFPTYRDGQLVNYSNFMVTLTFTSDPNSLASR